MDRFMGLDLVDKVPEELWTEICTIVQEAVTKTILNEKETQEVKVFAWGGVTNSWGKKRSNRQRKKADIPNWMQSSREQQGEIRPS